MRGDCYKDELGRIDYESGCGDCRVLDPDYEA